MTQHVSSSPSAPLPHPPSQIPYEFNQSDLSACTQFLQNHLTEMETKKANAPTWDTVRFMIAQIRELLRLVSLSLSDTYYMYPRYPFSWLLIN